MILMRGFMLISRKIRPFFSCPIDRLSRSSNLTAHDRRFAHAMNWAMSLCRRAFGFGALSGMAGRR